MYVLFVIYNPCCVKYTILLLSLHKHIMNKLFNKFFLLKLNIIQIYVIYIYD